MTRTKPHSTLKAIAGGTPNGSLGGGTAVPPGVTTSANVVAFAQGTRDGSGTLLTLPVNVTQNHLYQVIGYIMCVYDNYNDSFVGEIIRTHTNDSDLLIGYGRTEGWEGIYYAAVDMCVIDLADHTGTYNYELQLPKYTAGVVAKKYNLTVMDLGPKP